MKFCISNKLTGDANAAGPWITLLSSKVVRHKATITHVCTHALSLINPALKKKFFQLISNILCSYLSFCPMPKPNEIYTKYLSTLSLNLKIFFPSTII